jgi:hypothetical protein
MALQTNKTASVALVLIPGLKESPRSVNHQVTLLSRNHEVFPLLIGWDSPFSSASFQETLEKCSDQVTQYLRNYEQVVLVGVSAGASAAITIWGLLQFHPRIKTFIVCGRIRQGARIHESLTWRLYQKTHPLFIESVRRCEQSLGKISPKIASQITTYRGVIDELVPPSTTCVPQATNLQVSGCLHIINIELALRKIAVMKVNHLSDISI